MLRTEIDSQVCNRSFVRGRGLTKIRTRGEVMRVELENNLTRSPFTSQTADSSFGYITFPVIGESIPGSFKGVSSFSLFSI